MNGVWTETGHIRRPDSEALPTGCTAGKSIVTKPQPPLTHHAPPGGGVLGRLSMNAGIKLT